MGRIGGIVEGGLGRFCRTVKVGRIRRIGRIGEVGKIGKIERIGEIRRIGAGDWWDC